MLAHVGCQAALQQVSQPDYMQACAQPCSKSANFPPSLQTHSKYLAHHELESVVIITIITIIIT